MSTSITIKVVVSVFLQLHRIQFHQIGIVLNRLFNYLEMIKKRNTHSFLIGTQDRPYR